MSEKESEHRSPSPVEDTMDDVVEDAVRKGVEEERIHFQAKLLDAVGQAVIASDPQGKVIYWNHAAEELYGWSEEEAMGCSILEVTPSEELVDRAEEIMAELRAGRSWSGEFEVRRKDGTTFRAMVTDTPVFDQEGDLVAIIGVSTDISELKQTEELLRSEERFRLLVEGVQDYAIFMLDPEGRITSWNAGAERIKGYSAEEIVGRHFSRFYTDEDVERGHPEEELRLAQEQGRYEEEGWRVGKDGTRFWASVLITALRDEEGNLRGFSKVVRDVTERKRAEEALRESEERFRTAFEDAPIGVALVDLDGRRFRANRSLCEMLGCSEEDLLEDYLEHVHPDDRQISTEHFRRTLEEGAGSYELERRYLHADGHVIWNLTSVSLIRDSEGNPSHFVCLHQDITERKEAEKERTRRIRHTALRAEVSAALAEGGPLRSILQRCTECMVRHLEAAFARIWTLNEEEEVLELEASAGMYTRIDGTYSRVPVGEFKIGLIGQEHQPHLTNDVLGDPRISEKEWAKREGMVAFAGHPLVVENRVVGVMALFSRKPLEEDTIEALSSVADAVAQGIQRKKADEALRRSEASLTEAQRIAHLGSWERDVKTGEVYWSDETFRIYGYEPSEVVPTFDKVLELVHPDDRELIRKNIDATFYEGEPYDFEHRIVRPDGEVRWIHRRGEVVRGEGGEPLRMIGTVHDVTEHKALEEQLEHQAFHDELTELPNRRLFMDRLEQALRHTRRRRRGRKVAVLFIDLDNFKIINDSLSHEIGDKLLVAVAERLRGGLRPEDTLARFGGDEFTVLIEDVENPRDAVRVAERIFEGFRERFILDGKEFSLTASIGIALGTARTRRPEELLRDADMAMYRAKEDGPAKYKIFDPSMYKAVLERLELENNLRRALENEEFRVHYQPKVSLESGEVWGMEALVRWEHPERGLLDPLQFMSVAEETGLIVPLGRWVLEEACEQAKEWQERYPHIPPLVICVNLSARQLEHPETIDTIEEVLKKTGFEARCLYLDITETVYIRTAEAHTATLDRLKEMGVRISIDDFGTGYSSLSYLKRLPIDALKIDKSFIKGIGEDVEDTAMVQMIIDLAHTLGMKIVAEGVESEAQAEQLKEMGCDLAQGYYLTEPLPPQAVPELLAR